MKIENLEDKLLPALKGKEHIIWDWNGTLLDDLSHAVSIVNILLQEHNLPLITTEYYRQIFDFPVVNYYQKLGFNVEQKSFEKICHRFVELFMGTVYQVPLIPEMKSILIKMYQEGVTQSVLSASDQNSLDLMITHFKLNNIFKFVFGIEDKLGAQKIDRGQQLTKKSLIPLHKTIMVGDTLHDLEVANALGIDVVLISHGHQCPKRLHSRHHNVL